MSDLDSYEEIEIEEEYFTEDDDFKIEDDCEELISTNEEMPAAAPPKSPEKCPAILKFNVPLLFQSDAAAKSPPNYAYLAARVHTLERKLFEINLTKTN
jgi:hypothetical protein